MLKFGNKEFRNLQEQVLKNMQNIANLKEGTAVLSEFGIKVVGEVDSLQDLPSVIDYKTAHEDWEYGDAFAIGTEAPYTLVILTRANDEITADHWFDIGDFPAPGPQGAQGPQGEVGPQGQTGDTGPAGADAGFGSVLATAQTLPAGSVATATVTASGPNTAKEFSFTFGIPRGADGGNPVWGNIQGTLSDQTDLDNALDAKQDTLVSGTNIKTINNESILGSGNIDIQSGGDVTDVEVNGTSVVDAQGVAEITVPVDVSDLNNDAGYITSSALSGYATETWVGQQGYAETADLATVATTGSYADLTDKPSIPSKTSDLTNDSGYITGVAWGSITGTLLNQTDLNTALSGKQDTISDLATIRSGAEAGATAVQPAAISDMATETWVGQQGYLTSVSWSEVSDKPAFATVATSGDYDDLTNKPTIPAAQVNSDWSAVSGVAQILNKPTNLVTTDTAQAITGQKTFGNVSFASRPNFTNGLQFDYGISHEITVKESGSGSSGTYNFDFPAASGTLALTSDIPTTMAWADITGKPTFATVATSGSYNDLSNKPTIPTNNNQLTNGAGYQTASEVSTAISTATTNMVTTNTAQTISGAKTFSDSNGIKLKNSNLTVDETYIYLADLGATYAEIDKRGLVINTNSTGSIDYGSGGIAILTSPEDSVQGISLVPYIAPNTGTKPRRDLGKPDMQWRNLYLSGNITDGTNSITVANIANKSNSETWTFTLSDGTTTTKTIVLG